MGVVNPFSILVRECDGLFVRCPHPCYHLESCTVCTTFKYVFLDLKDCPVKLPPMITLISPSGGRDDSSIPLQPLVLVISSKEIS